MVNIGYFYADLFPNYTRILHLTLKEQFACWFLGFSLVASRMRKMPARSLVATVHLAKISAIGRHLLRL